MSRGPLLFKESDVVRAVKAVRKAGLDIARVEIDSSGKIVVIAKTENNGNTDRKTNPWDNAA